MVHLRMHSPVDRINNSDGINGRPVELIIADYESKPDVGRRKAEKLVVEDKIDAHVGGYLSNVCLACMPAYEETKIVNLPTVRLRPRSGHRALPGQ
jgi:branched-chain amino acid transport system substrate-binding protein